MPTTGSHNQRGRDTPLVRERWEPNEVGICCVLAAVWDRIEHAARRFLLGPVFDALGEEPPVTSELIEIWSEVPWATPGTERNQRQDVVLTIQGWGTLVLEAKVHQWYWHASGPARLRDYAKELRRRLDAKVVSGPRGAVVALTPFAALDGEVTVGDDGIGMAGITWFTLSRAVRDAAGNDDWPVAQALLPELLRVLEERGLDRPLHKVGQQMLQGVPKLFTTLDQFVPATDSYLAALAREAESLGLTDPDVVVLADTALSSTSFRRPYINWAPLGAARDEAFVGVVFDLENLVAHFLAGVQFSEAAPVPEGFAATLLKAGPPADCSLFAWSDRRVQHWPCDDAGADALDVEPADLEDFEWRGLGFTRPLITADEPAFGEEMLRRHLSILAEKLAPVARAVFRSDLDAVAPRPPAAAVLETLARWPKKALSEVPRSVPLGAKRPFGWTDEAIVDAWMRRLTDRNGKLHQAGPKYHKWATPLKSSGLYLGSDGVRCCGLRMIPAKKVLKTECPVCKRKWWNTREIKALLP